MIFNDIVIHWTLSDNRLFIRSILHILTVTLIHAYPILISNANRIKMDTKDQHINQFLIAVATELVRYKTLPKILIDQHFAYPFDSTVWRCDKEYNRLQH